MENNAEQFKIVTNDEGKNNAADDTAGIREMLAGNIVAYRKKMKISRAELAKKAGVTEMAIGQYERGVRMPQIPTLCKIADLFGISIDMLIGRSSISNSLIDEYRFGIAVDICHKLNLIVLESAGQVELRKINRQKASIDKTSTGITVKKSELKMHEVFLTFEDRESFLLFVEEATNSILSDEKNLLALKKFFDTLNEMVPSTGCLF